MNNMGKSNSYCRFLTWFMALALSALLAGCGGGGGGGQAPILGGGGNITPLSAKAITDFSIAGVTATVDEAGKTIAVNVPNGTDVTVMAATFTAPGASVKVGAVAQTSGTTTNDFTSPVTYTVTAADGSTTTYVVTVNVSSITAKAISAYSLAGVAGTVDEAAKTIAVSLPNGTDVTALVATFTNTGSSVKVGTVTQTSGTTPNDFTSMVAYTVTAADASTATYNVSVSVSAASAKAISAYSFARFPVVAGTINEAAKTIAVSVPFGTDVTALVGVFTASGVSVKVGGVAQTSGTTPNDFSSPVTYTVSAADGSTAAYDVTVSVGSASAKAITAYSFVGYPAAAGTIDEAAKTIVVNVPNGTDVTALKAKFTSTGANVKVGAAVQTSTETPNDFTSAVTYTVTAADGSTAAYAVTVTLSSSSAKAITAYSFVGYTGATGTIDEAAKTVAVTVPNGTDVTMLAATFNTTGASVKVGTTVQASGTTQNDFTAPVAYKVTAADGSTATYTVSVSVSASSAKAITAYSFVAYPSAAGVIDEAAKTIAVTVPNGADVTALKAQFTTTGANVKIGAAVQTSTETQNDFTSPVTYTVSAADGTSVDYVVTVSVGAAATVLPGAAGGPGAAATNPTVISSSPSNGDTNVPTQTNKKIVGGANNVVTAKVVTATFNEPMDPATITPVGTFTLRNDTLGIDVPGSVAMNTANTIATFTPTAAALALSTDYTATITTAAKNAGSITAMPNPVAWSFKTMGASSANQATPFLGQAPVNLLSAVDFVLLAQTQITEAGPVVGRITGNVGLSPATGAQIFVTCTEVTGTIYSVDATGPACKVTDDTLLTAAIGDKDIAYTEAAGRVVPDATELGAGNISGLTFYPGLYKWSSDVNINTDVTLDAQGDTNAVWIFQIAGDLTIAAGGGDVASGIKVILIGGAKAANVFWQVGGGVGATLNTFSTFNGTILSAKQVVLRTGAVLNGRALATTQIVLDANQVTKPAP